MTPRTLSKGAVDFIDDAALTSLITDRPEDPMRVRDIIAKSMQKEPLTVEEVADLLAADSEDSTEALFAAARQLKQEVYGNRIVIFAPLYIGNHCINDCHYCAFRRSLRTTVRKTLTEQELDQQVLALEQAGHKRLILVFGEHPNYTPEYMARTVEQVYSIKDGHGEIRRVNINAAPLDHEGFKTIKAAGIGTYQIFQETYHHDTYSQVHPAQTHKGDYAYRLDGLTRAYEAGCDDVGIGALFGLYDWRFEVLGLVAHSRYLVDRFGCGPHTISFPRIRPAHGVEMDEQHMVSDRDFKRLVAILRLAVPYTGMILTAREPAEIRREVMEFGVSQIDAGTRIELAGYTKHGEQELNREQFQIGDMRSLDEIMQDLMQHNYIPSFCTSCYRQGRTGEQFMEFAVPGFIENFCTPNAILTLAEYLEDYGSADTKAAGIAIIEKEMAGIDDATMRAQVAERVGAIRANTVRDVYY
ncbi:MAG: [FeFe] hydrogenase H-cluster radical SAM maturase HydG [Verrucomicrobia bacterium]|jgi:2-iminoacetate synthase|nr:[FeFe] hydrogenase H-cluster radical SAM maturase HydG [Verrucomicrobiota bacterium]MBT7067378.1 [FeFe] hydrogenase H-cluster radical SAM maturase HydG [Verrucomicrobiota bacterium]MBT7700007.1 [FeFe] hydrogenase H-cluster radical SAM maturase HydG [Verrucomicrobiota bacterium]